MRPSPSSSAATPAIRKQGGYPELEQSQASSGAQRQSERALGQQMRERSKDADGQQTLVPEDNTQENGHGR